MPFHDEDCSSLSSVEDGERIGFMSETGPSWRKRHLNRLHSWSWMLQLLLFAASVVLNLSTWWHRHTEVSCVQRQSVYSPALEAISDDFETWRFNGTLAARSPYKGPPSPEVDAAWDAITAMPVISIPLETIKVIGASNDSVRLPPESGGGYMAEVAVFHQLHCVNLLWKGTYADYYQNRSISWTDPPEIVRQHLDHCADMLRQKLQCDADASLITFDWVKGYSRPYENFNSLHKCRNFGALQAWTRAHGAPASPTGPLTRLPGSVDRETPP